MYLLDTNIVSALRRPERLPPRPTARLAAIHLEDCFLSVITVMEIEIGVRRLERVDPVQAAPLRRWKTEWLAETFLGRLLPVDWDVAERTAAMHVPDPKSPNDALIAATAISRAMILITRNVDDFVGIPVRLLNPWDPD